MVENNNSFLICVQGLENKNNTSYREYFDIFCYYIFCISEIVMYEDDALLHCHHEVIVLC